MSRNERFLFYPALVRLAFGECEPDDISFDLREAFTLRVGYFGASTGAAGAKEV